MKMSAKKVFFILSLAPFSLFAAQNQSTNTYYNNNEAGEIARGERFGGDIHADGMGMKGGMGYDHRDYDHHGDWGRYHDYNYGDRGVGGSLYINEDSGYPYDSSDYYYSDPNYYNSSSGAGY